VRKFIKYNHLVANLLSFHTLVTMRFCLRVVVIIMSVLSFIGSRAAPVPTG
jgi:hypothetical protein